MWQAAIAALGRLRWKNQSQPRLLSQPAPPRYTVTSLMGMLPFQVKKAKKQDTVHLVLKDPLLTHKWNSRQVVGSKAGTERAANDPQ